MLCFSPILNEWAAAIILIVVFICFLRERIPPEITALGGMVAMVVCGILPAEKAMQAFANEAVVMVAAMLVVCLAIERAGLLVGAGRLYEKLAGNSQRRGLWFLMLFCGTVSAFLNNTSVVIIFLPIVMAVCRRQGIPASRVLIPLSFATVAGGMMTMIGTSTNLVVAGLARESGISFSMFEIGGLGLAVYAVSLLYLGLLGPKLLPDRHALSQLLEETQSREYLTRAFIAPDSPLCDVLFSASPLSKLRGIRLIEVIRDGGIVQSHIQELRLQARDQLILKGRLEDVLTMRQTEGIEMVPRDSLGLEQVKTEKAVLMEAVLGPGSSLLHKSMKQVNFRQRYGVLVLAVHRMGVNLREQFEEMRFLTGDTILLEGPAEQMNQLFKERGFINLTKAKDTRPRKDKAWISVAIMALVAIFGALAEIPADGEPPDPRHHTAAQAASAAVKEAVPEAGASALKKVAAATESALQPQEHTLLTKMGLPPMNFAIIALLGALLCVLFRCVDMPEIFEAMEWRILLMIIGAVGIGAGLNQSGLAADIANSITGTLKSVGAGPWIVLSAIYLISVILTEFLSNAAVAAIITPIAIQAASQMGVDAKPFVVAAMFGSTLAFSTPIGYQTNLLVYNAGGYRFADFCRIGIPLTILLWILGSLLIPLIWPFAPAL